VWPHGVHCQDALTDPTELGSVQAVTEMNRLLTAGTTSARRATSLNSIFNWKEPRPLGLNANAPPSCLRIVAVLPVPSAGVAMAIMVRQRHLSNMF